jgi:hypothetical protein
MNTFRAPHLFRSGATLLVFTLSAAACDFGGPDVPDISGTWLATVPAADVDLTMVLMKLSETDIIGSADLVFASDDTAAGNVSGLREGLDVELTIHVSEAAAAGSIAFSGAFRGDDTLEGSLSSGLLGGSHSVTFRRRTE